LIALKWASILDYFALIVGILGLFWTHSLFSSSLVVIVCQALAVLLGIWARLSFGRRSFHVAANPTAGGLVTTGPYRFIRHPIYTAVCLFTMAGALAHWSGKGAWFAGLVLAPSGQQTTLLRPGRPVIESPISRNKEESDQGANPKGRGVGRFLPRERSAQNPDLWALAGACRFQAGPPRSYQASTNTVGRQYGNRY
jgi:Phospholipid methyltransferase